MNSRSNSIVGLHISIFFKRKKKTMKMVESLTLEVQKE